jgi:hypothetical protein
MDDIADPRDVRGDLHERYSNFLDVGENESEFFLDFGVFHLGGGSPRFHTRIITTPKYAKAMAEALTDALSRNALRAIERDCKQEGLPPQ